jgi:hypothetical protein
MQQRERKEEMADHTERKGLDTGLRTGAAMKGGLLLIKVKLRQKDPKW